MVVKLGRDVELLGDYRQKSSRRTAMKEHRRIDSVLLELNWYENEQDMDTHHKLCCLISGSVGIWVNKAGFGSYYKKYFNRNKLKSQDA